MKTRAAIIATTLLVASQASAAPVSSGGPFSDSKIEGAAPVVTSAVGATASTQATSKSAASNIVKKTIKPSVAVEVKQWARNQWANVKSFWGSPAKSVGQPAGQQVAQQPKAAKPAVGNNGTNRVVASLPGDTNAPAAPGVAANASAASAGAPVAPAAPVAAAAPAVAVAPSAPKAPIVNPPGLKVKDNGVAVFDFKSSPSIPRLDIGREEKVRASQYALDIKMQKVMDERIIHPFPSPDALKAENYKRLVTIATGQPTAVQNVKHVAMFPRGKVSREAFDQIVYALKPELAVKLQNVVPLTAEEVRFLSGLLLYQQGDKCAAAVGLFHKLTKAKDWQAEADYYLAMCSRQLGLETDFMERARRVFESKDAYYSKKILKEIGPDVPYEFTEKMGAALMKAVAAGHLDKSDAKTTANLGYLLAEYGADSDQFKVALEWAKKVPAKHPKAPQARFIESLAEYQVGSKERALKIQEELISDITTGKAKNEFQALVALNLARMYFQEQKFKKAHEAFLKVYKDHPLWLQSLTELGWSQLMNGDFEGAIGNMYSIQSPFFSQVYKPESFVIRTIGYLNLCQYGDAYRTLSILEKEYRPQFESMERYIAGKPAYYQTVRNFLQQAAKGPKEVDGLPAQAIREMARHRDFTNLQNALNRQIDERDIYSRLDSEIEKSLKRAQGTVAGTQARIKELQSRLSTVANKRELEQNRKMWQAQLDKAQEDLLGYQFEIELFGEAKAALVDYRKDVLKGVDQRLASMKSSMETVLSKRLARMKTDLARILENNELLRYEVFAGSGENIRYQVAGGEQGNRVPASVLPKSKSLQWAFDGEYWEDEIGHYRSSLKNNCPDAGQQRHAANGGEE